MAEYVVAGVTGHTGSVVAQTLLDSGRKVRVLIRDPHKAERWKKRGAHVGPDRPLQLARSAERAAGDGGGLLHPALVSPQHHQHPRQGEEDDRRHGPGDRRDRRQARRLRLVGGGPARRRHRARRPAARCRAGAEDAQDAGDLPPALLLHGELGPGAPGRQGGAAQHLPPGRAQVGPRRRRTTSARRPRGCSSSTRSSTGWWSWPAPRTWGRRTWPGSSPSCSTPRSSPWSSRWTRWPRRSPGWASRPSSRDVPAPLRGHRRRRLRSEHPESVVRGKDTLEQALGGDAGQALGCGRVRSPRTAATSPAREQG